MEEELFDSSTYDGITPLQRTLISTYPSFFSRKEHLVQQLTPSDIVLLKKYLSSDAQPLATEERDQPRLKTLAAFLLIPPLIKYFTYTVHVHVPSEDCILSSEHTISGQTLYTLALASTSLKKEFDSLVLSHEAPSLSLAAFRDFPVNDILTELSKFIYAGIECTHCLFDEWIKHVYPQDNLCPQEYPPQQVIYFDKVKRTLYNNPSFDFNTAGTVAYNLGLIELAQAMAAGLVLRTGLNLFNKEEPYTPLSLSPTMEILVEEFLNYNQKIRKFIQRAAVGKKECPSSDSGDSSTTSDEELHLNDDPEIAACRRTYEDLSLNQKLTLFYIVEHTKLPKKKIKHKALNNVASPFFQLVERLPEFLMPAAKNKLNIKNK